MACFFCRIKESADFFLYVMPLDSIIIHLAGRAVHRDAHFGDVGVNAFLFAPAA